MPPIIIFLDCVFSLIHKSAYHLHRITMEQRSILFYMLLGLSIFNNTGVHTKGCDEVFPGTPTFGSNCKFRCHCANDGVCDKNDCFNNACEKGWMGPKCQYRNVLTNYLSTKQEGENFNLDSDLAVDGDRETCSETGQLQHDGRHSWKVQLQRKYNIVGMKIYILENDIENFHQFRVETGPTSTSFPDLCYEHPNEQGKKVMEITCITPLVTQNIRIVLNSANVPLRLCEVEIYGGRDVAFNMPTEQSTDYGIWMSSRAVDGRYHFVNDSIGEESMCSRTDGNENNPWWRINLQQPFVIKDISFFGRSVTVENSKGFYISIGNSSTALKEIFHDQMETIDPTHYMPRDTEFTTEYKTKFVKFSLKPFSGTVALSICEIHIFADCLPNRCGWDCDKICHCRSETTGMMKIDGVCPHGCSGRWTGRNGKCDKECNDTSWGESCQEKCGHCLKSACEVRSGFCIDGCSGPWIPPQCIEPCAQGTFGLNCEEDCGHCVSGTVCDTVSGVCPKGCKSGWKGPLCDSQCDDGSHGAGCLQDCGQCINDTVCDRQTGECEHGCHPGFGGSQCNKDFNLLTSIKGSVTVTISSIYRNWGPKRAIDGSLNTMAESCECCSGTGNAEESWLKLDLKKIYPIRKLIIYGRSNENIFQQLVGFKVTLQNSTTEDIRSVYTNKELHQGIAEVSLPDSLARYVKIQRTGKLTVCEVRVVEGDCRIGRFGKQCSRECHCADRKQCDRKTGTCMSPICELGYTGAACETECPRTYFGQDCDRNCFCYGDADCTKDYGICPGDCAPGYSGDHCENVCSHGWYGFRCVHECGRCQKDEPCDHISGECSNGCKTGYDGELCNHALNLLERKRTQIKATMSSTYGAWGADRAIDTNIGPNPSTCDCCSSTLNEVSSFWRVYMGKIYPLNRVEIFPRDNEAAYHHLTGFELILKNTSYETGITVYKNEDISYSAFVGIPIQNVLAKVIEVRRTGKLTLCEVKAYEGDCRIGHYGEECKNTCHCADKQACDRVTGKCVSPVCSVGWRGSACNTVCESGYYGQHCAQKCDKCKDGTSCDPETGSCPGEGISDSVQLCANVGLMWLTILVIRKIY